LDEVYAQAEVSERDLAKLRPGLEVIVTPDAYPSSHWQGKIERLEPMLKEESRTVVAKIGVPNPDDRLKPGMFARLEIVLDKTPQVVAVPKAALLLGPDKTPQVFVILDEVAFLRKVVPGLVTENWVEIKKGVKPGEAVVVEGAERLKELARVISSPVAPPVPSQINPSPAPSTTSPEGSKAIPSQKESAQVPENAPQAQSQDKSAEKSFSQPEPFPLTSSHAPQKPRCAKGLTAPTPSAVPPSPEPAPKPEVTKPTVYQVAPGEGILKIVATYYPDNKEIGYDAIILANPEITNEDNLYPGQKLSLPQIDKSNNAITLENNEHFAIFKQYYNSSDKEKAVSKLKELQMPFVARETRVQGVKVFRIFLGGYASIDGLKKAVSLAEKN
jgi:hypothetical protein